jgi:hypothetical protein
MGKKYDIVIRRNLGGIGIWALGYDDGYGELWNLIEEKFSTEGALVLSDTIFDSGGPTHDYYNDENYMYTISVNETSNIFLSFTNLNLEPGYDTLWIYDGQDETSPLIDVFTGDTIPSMIYSSGNTLSLKFFSDVGITSSGWRAVYDTMPVSDLQNTPILTKLNVMPNPASKDVIIHIPMKFILAGHPVLGKVISSSGRTIQIFEIFPTDPSYKTDVSGWKKGIYIIELSNNSSQFYRSKLIIN